MREVVTAGLSSMLVPRLTPQAMQELAEVSRITESVVLSEGADVRVCFAAGGDEKLQAGMVYQALCGGNGSLDDEAKFIWKNGAPPRVQFFGWLASRGRIQCRSILDRKGLVQGARCEVCNGSDETTPHVLFHCDLARQLWARLHIRTPAHDHQALLHLVERPPSFPAKHFNTFVLLCCWSLWKRRNLLVFEGLTTSWRELLVAIRAEANLWKHRLKAGDQGVVDFWCSELAFNM